MCGLPSHHDGRGSRTTGAKHSQVSSPSLSQFNNFFSHFPLSFLLFPDLLPSPFFSLNYLLPPSSLLPTSSPLLPTSSLLFPSLYPSLFRYLLKFGKVSHYVGYNAMSDFFPSWSMKPNPQCDNHHCRLRQQEHQVLTPSLPHTTLLHTIISSQCSHHHLLTTPHNHFFTPSHNHSLTPLSHHQLLIALHIITSSHPHTITPSHHSRTITHTTPHNHFITPSHKS